MSFLKTTLKIDSWLHWVLLAVPRLSIIVASRACSPAAVQVLLVALAPLFLEHGPQSAGSAVVVHRLSCPVTCEIFLQGLNLCFLISKQIVNHWTTREV